MHLIETQHLSFAYRDTVRALDDVNFVAPRNVRIAVIGPNGAGKSTLFRHLNGVLLAREGQVLVRGEPVTKKNLKEVRKFVGVVFQNPDDQIFAPTVEQDIAFGPTNLGLDETTVMHRVDEALGLLGIEYLRHRAPHHLSGGEKKRVAIAGVLAMEPGVLVMDEPTAGLDPRGRDDLIRFVNGLSEDYGMTVIISTHELDLVTEFADYVYVMDRGSIQAQGTVEEIFEQEEMLRRVRLDVPVLPKLCRSLRRRGADLPVAYTFDEVEQNLAAALKVRQAP
jgi:cobalt/nickel transport system ATP-binding protein